MKTSKIKDKKNFRVETNIFLGLSLIVLYFNPNLQDPFNAPKLWLLMIVAAALFGNMIFPNSESLENNKNIKLLLIALTSFISFGIISVFFSQNIIVSLFGENQRKNGLVTYFCLSLIMYAIAKNITESGIKKLSPYLVTISIILVVYGFMQHSGKDFIKWDNPYNSLIGTAGNPNFSSAIFAILGTYMFTYAINIKTRSIIYNRYFFMILTLLIFINIYNTNARQGLLAFIVGCFVALLVRLYYGNRIISIIASFAIITITVFGIIGMLRIGPLQSFLYKDSVSVRGYYWRAGIEMLKSHPYFGVGLDDYGSYFNFYRELKYPITYGFDVTSSNAHNVFIQQFATGGIFFGSIYFLLQVYIFLIGVKLIKNSKAENRYLITAIFSSWVAFEAQSVVSIDNIAISVFGWVFGGIIIGCNARLSQSDAGKIKRDSQITEIKQLLVSSLLVFIIFIFCVFLYRGENNMIKIRNLYNPNNTDSSAQLYNLAQSTIKLPLVDSSYKNQIAYYLITTGNADQAVEILKSVLSSNPNSLDALNLISNLYDSSKKYEDANYYRRIIAEKNPWNAKNYLQLGINYRETGDIENMQKMLAKIESFASDTDVYSKAKLELVVPR